MSDSYTISALLLARCRIPKSVQEHVSSDEAAHLALSANQSLDPVVWSHMWATSRANLEVATRLVSRGLPPALVDQVIAKESRVSVIGALAAFNQLSLDQVRVVCAKGKSTSIASTLYRSYYNDPSIASLVGPLSGPSEYVQWLSRVTPTELPDDSVLDALRRLSVWWGGSRHYSELSVSLKRLFSRRPTLLAVVLEQGLHDSIYTAAASNYRLASLDQQLAVLGVTPLELPGITSSKRLVQFPEYASLALANNPRALPEVLALLQDHSTSYSVRESVGKRRRFRPTIIQEYEKLDDQAQLSWLCDRLTLSDKRPDRSAYFRPRPYELVALAKNEHLLPSQAKDVFTELYSSDTIDEIGAKQVGQVARLMASRYGLAYEPVPTPPRSRQVTAPVFYGPTLRSRPRLLWELEEALELDNAESQVTSKLGDSPHSWAVFIKLLDEHPQDSLERLVKMAALLGTLNQ